MLIKTIIDLRNHREIDKNPDTTLASDIKYYNVSIGIESKASLSKAKKHGLELSLISTFYLLIAMQSKKYLKKFRYIS